MSTGLQTNSSRLPSLGNIEIDIKIGVLAKNKKLSDSYLFVIMRKLSSVQTKKKLCATFCVKYASFPCINKLIEMDVNR